MTETRLSCIKCLPLALLQVRTAPRKDIGVSPYEVVFGLPYLGREEGLPCAETNDLYLRNYLQVMTLSLTADLRRKGLLPQTSPLDFHRHQVKPADLVLIKSWKDDTLNPAWEGPFQVLLTTETAIRTAEKGGGLTPLALKYLWKLLSKFGQW